MKTRRLIVYFVPPEKIVNGGVMSIFSQCVEARKLQKLHNADVVLSTYAGSTTYKKNDLFENSEVVYDFNYIIKNWPTLDFALFHIPEVAIGKISEAFSKNYNGYIKEIGLVQINIMNQNIDLMPPPGVIAPLFNITANITQTTAHQKYATQMISNTYQTPVHHLSVWLDEKQYKKTPYEQKENLIIYSPDKHPKKEMILSKLSDLTNFKLLEIKGLTYENFKITTSKAKFALTFGEGMDGYFIESYFSGGIGLAVYNDRFFPSSDFLEFPGVFKDYLDLENNLLSRIKQLDSPNLYNQCTNKGLKGLSLIYNKDTYLKKLKAFYSQSYDFAPQPNTASVIIADAVAYSRVRLLEQESEYERKLAKAEEKLVNEQKKAKQLSFILAEMENSKSWKLTKPLRALFNIKRN